jgi:hypothetical protein
MSAREQAVRINGFLDLVRQLKLAAIVRVLDEHNVRDANGDLARQILEAQNVDNLAADAWRNGKRNAADIGAEMLDRWWQSAKAARQK